MPTPSANIEFRSAFADEVARAASICEDSKIQATGQGACFVAVKDRPVERIVGAAFWRMLPCEAGQTATEAEFEWNVVASLVGSEHEQGFLKAIRSEVRNKAPGAKQLAIASWLPEANVLIERIQAAGYERAESRNVFQGNVSDWQKQLESTLASGVSEDYVIVPPEPEHFDALKELLCSEGTDQGIQLRPFELARGFQTAGGESPSLFDTRCSRVLLAKENVVGVCLANVNKVGHLSIEGLAEANLPEDSQLLVDHLLGHAFCGATELGASGNVSYFVDEREPTGPLAHLADRFPVQLCGTTHRYVANLKVRSSKFDVSRTR